MDPITEREREEIDRANDSHGTPVVFIHGLWLLASSWGRWRALFEEQGYVTLAPAWPDEPTTVREANRRPELFARKRIRQVTDHCAEVIGKLQYQPAIVGHSVGGLIAQKLAGMGLAGTTVAINPTPFRGVLPLPFSSLKAARPVLRNPLNYRRSVPLTYEQFRYAFANAVSEQEARQLYRSYAVPGPGAPLFQSAIANLNPVTEARVDTANPNRGALLILSGELDNVVPWSQAYAAYERQKRNPGVTRIHEMPGRGHSLTIDSGWKEVAETALEFVERYQPPRATGWRAPWESPLPEFT